MTNRKALIWFLLITFGLSWPLFLLPLAFRSAGQATTQTITMLSWAVAMWSPGIAAIITNRFVLKQPLSNLHIRHLGARSPYLFAWIIPPLLAVVAGVLTVVFGAGQLDLNFTMLREALAQTNAETQLSVEMIVGIQIAFALVLGPLFNVVFAFGEELGWRGFLLPALLPAGQWRAILISSAIWGIWHAPAIAQGHNYPGQPVLGIGMMVVWCLLVGVGMSWLYLKTQSPWAPALAHGSLNATAGLAMLFIRDVNVIIGGTLPSLIGWIGLGVLVLWMVVTRRVPVELVSGEDTFTCGDFFPLQEPHRES